MTTDSDDMKVTHLHVTTAGADIEDVSITLAVMAEVIEELTSEGIGIESIMVGLAMSLEALGSGRVQSVDHRH